MLRPAWQFTHLLHIGYMWPIRSPNVTSHLTRRHRRIALFDRSLGLEHPILRVPLPAKGLADVLPLAPNHSAPRTRRKPDEGGHFRAPYAYTGTGKPERKTSYRSLDLGAARNCEHFDFQ